MTEQAIQPRLVYSAGEEGREDAPVQIIDRLRECLFRGELVAGSKLSEPALAHRFGVSRTPVRAALQRLQIEGWLDSTSNGGYRVKQFSRADVASALEIHAALEGLAVRLAAERGVPSTVMSQAREVLIRIDVLLSDEDWSDRGFEQYLMLNHDFHGFLIKMADNPMLESTLAQVHVHPLSIAGQFLLNGKGATTATRTGVLMAQEQHRCVLDAIKRQQGSRAEALVREHAALLERCLTATKHVANAPFLGRVC